MEQVSRSQSGGGNRVNYPLLYGERQPTRIKGLERWSGRLAELELLEVKKRRKVAEGSHCDGWQIIALPPQFSAPSPALIAC
ncbi:MAG: hypothetical protein ACJA1W_001920 [Akkermansiaceae bacterium]